MTTDQKPTVFVRALGVLFVLLVLGALVVTARAFYRADWKPLTQVVRGLLAVGSR